MKINFKSSTSKRIHFYNTIDHFSSVYEVKIKELYYNNVSNINKLRL